MIYYINEFFFKKKNDKKEKEKNNILKITDVEYKEIFDSVKAVVDKWNNTPSLQSYIIKKINEYAKKEDSELYDKTKDMKKCTIKVSIYERHDDEIDFTLSSSDFPGNEEQFREIVDEDIADKIATESFKDIKYVEYDVFTASQNYDSCFCVYKTYMTTNRK